MDEDFIRRIAASGLPVHNASGLPVFYNNGDDDLYVWGKTNRKRGKAIVISVPRSGTHFTSKLLAAMGMIYGSLHVSPKVESDVVQDRRCFQLNPHGKPFWPEYKMAVADAFRLVGPGQFIQGHVPFSEENQAALADFKIVVARRNLRDVAVSSMRFIASLHAKGMRFRPELDAQWCPLPDGAEKMLGYLNSFGAGVKAHVDKIAPWEACANAQVLDFDVINGADEAAALAAIIRTAGFLGADIGAQKARAVRKRAVGGGTVTWTGKLSRWQELWNDEVEETFRRVVLDRDGAAPPAPAAEAAAPAPLAAARSAPPAGSIAWLRKGELVNQAMPDAPGGAQTALMSEICKDRLLTANQARRLTLDLSARRYLTDGVLAELRDGTLCMRSGAASGGHRHLTVPIEVGDLGLNTLEVLHRPLPDTPSFMLQMGNENGFFNSFVDCARMRVTRIVSHGGSASLCTSVEAADDGLVKVSLSGFIGAGARSYIRIYLCGANGELEFDGQVSLSLERLDLLYG